VVVPEASAPALEYEGGPSSSWPTAAYHSASGGASGDECPQGRQDAGLLAALQSVQSAGWPPAALQPLTSARFAAVAATDPLSVASLQAAVAAAVDREVSAAVRAVLGSAADSLASPPPPQLSDQQLPSSRFSTPCGMGRFSAEGSLPMLLLASVVGSPPPTNRSGVLPQARASMPQLPMSGTHRGRSARAAVASSALMGVSSPRQSHHRCGRAGAPCTLRAALCTQMAQKGAPPWVSGPASPCSSGGASTS
jgi:hypothetical protein